MLSSGTLAKPVEGHATRRPAGLYSDRGGEHGKADSAGDLSNAPGEHHMPQTRTSPPLAAFKKFSGPAFPHVPDDILSGGSPSAPRHPATAQRI
jgi:hypothetical protein